MQFKNLLQLVNQFKDENVCRKHLEQMIWNGKPTCPHCTAEKAYSLSDGRTYKCQICSKKFTVTVGTIFENTKIPLQKWFVAIYLATSHKKGISSCQLAKDIGISQKSAWYMLHRIRLMFEHYMPDALLDGVVECDESYIGGKNRNKHFNKKHKNTQGRNMTDKIGVFGVMQRGGPVYTYSVPNVKAGTLKPLVYAHVESGSTVITDDWLAYRGLDMYYHHFYTIHSSGNYVDKDNSEIHTNNMENYWSHMKRSIIGCYHHVSRKHVDRYCQEWQYRYNQRHYEDHHNFNIALQQSAGKRLTFKQLIA